jgi:EmrB/QacA subfamily drug resistance transporter
MTPQTMAVITRTFRPNLRGAAMGLWGATAGVATLVGPLLGGVLVDSLGWEWIFFVNLPVGVIAFIAAWILVPKLQTHPHRFDILGVVLSAAAIFLVVFGLQEGEKYDWGVIWGPISVWGLIIAGIVLLAVFILQQWKTKSEALVPLELFRDRNFSGANIAIATVGFAVTSMSLPLMFFLQIARGLTPTQAALLMIPMAVFSGVLAPLAGRILDRTDPRLILIPGLIFFSVALLWYSSLVNMDSEIWMFLFPSALLGIGSAGMWGPLATTATRMLPMRQAGAGAGIYNTTRTIGSVVGSASIATFMQARLEANLPGMDDAAGSIGSGGALPAAVADGFAAAMSQAILLPASVIVIGLIASLFLRGAPKQAAPAAEASAPSAPVPAPAE